MKVFLCTVAVLVATCSAGYIGGSSAGGAGVIYAGGHSLGGPINVVEQQEQPIVQQLNPIQVVQDQGDQVVGLSSGGYTTGGYYGASGGYAVAAGQGGYFDGGYSIGGAEQVKNIQVVQQHPVPYARAVKAIQVVRQVAAPAPYVKTIHVGRQQPNAIQVVHQQPAAAYQYNPVQVVQQRPAPAYQFVQQQSATSPHFKTIQVAGVPHLKTIQVAAAPQYEASQFVQEEGGAGFDVYPGGVYGPEANSYTDGVSYGGSVGAEYGGAIATYKSIGSYGVQ